MRIVPMNVVVGVAAGAIDEVLEWQDAQGGRNEIVSMWTTWGRVGLCALGYLGQAFNFFPAIAAPLAQSEVALVTKTVGSAIRSGAGVSRQAVTHPRTRVSQTAGPGFKGLETY